MHHNGMDDRSKPSHKSGAHEKASHASMGRAIMKFAITFVAVCVIIPFCALMREYQKKESYSLSPWWLKSSNFEITTLNMEGNLGKLDDMRNLSRWAHQERGIASMYSDIFGKGAFCRSGKLIPQRQVLSSEPTIWDASIGGLGSVVNVVLSYRNIEIPAHISRSKDIDSSSYHHGKRVTCRLYDHRSQLLTTVTSLPIVNDILVRCPIPFDLRRTGQGHDIRMIIKLVWSEMGNSRKKSSTGLQPSAPSPTEDIKRGSYVMTAKSASLNQTALDASKASILDIVRSVGSDLGSRQLYPVCPLALADRHGKGTEVAFKTGWGLGYGMGGGSGGNLRGNANYQLDRARDRKRERRSDEGAYSTDGKYIGGAVSRSHTGPNLKPNFNLNSKSDSKKELISESLPISVPIIPPILPGWSGAGLPRRSIPAFPEDTTHTYELSVCAATSRGYAATQSKADHQKALLVEWIEYHRLVGVQHFFIYDTYTHAPPPSPIPRRLLLSPLEVSVAPPSLSVSTSGNSLPSPSQLQSPLQTVEQHPSFSSTSSTLPLSFFSSGSEPGPKSDPEGEKSTSKTMHQQHPPPPLSSGIPSAILSTKDASHNSFVNGSVDNGTGGVERGRAADSNRQKNVGNNNRPNLERDLSRALADYLALGLVTIIPWHHTDCDRTKDYSNRLKGFAGNSSRSSAGNPTVDPVCPPIGAPRLRSVAEASCYLRFRPSSRWMAVLSPDEFLGIDISQRIEGSEYSDLPSMLSALEDAHSHLAAVELKSAAYLPCSEPSVAVRNLTFDSPHHGGVGSSSSGSSSRKGNDTETSLYRKLQNSIDSVGSFSQAYQSGPVNSSSLSSSLSSSTASDDQLNERNKKGDEESSPSSPRFGLYAHSRPLGPQENANGVRTFNRLIVRTDYTVYFSGTQLMVESPYRPTIAVGDSVAEAETSTFRTDSSAGASEVSLTELDPVPSSLSRGQAQAYQPAVTMTKDADKTSGVEDVVDGLVDGSSTSIRAGITLGDDINDTKGSMIITPFNTSSSDPLIAFPPVAELLTEAARTRTKARRLSAVAGEGGGGGGGVGGERSRRREERGGGEEVIGGLRRGQSMDKEGEGKGEGRVRGRGGGGSRGRGRKRTANDRRDEEDKVHSTSTLGGQYRRTDGQTSPLPDPHSFHRGGEGMSEREAKRAPHGRQALEGEYTMVEVPISVAAVMHFRVVAPLRDDDEWPQPEVESLLSSRQGGLRDREGVGERVTGAAVETQRISASGTAGSGTYPLLPPSPSQCSEVMVAEEYDVVDAPIYSLPPSMRFHSLKGREVDRAEREGMSEVVKRRARERIRDGAGDRDERPADDRSPPPGTHPSLHLHSSPLSSLCSRGSVVHHTAYSRHWEELLGDRFLRAMAGAVPEGYGKEEREGDDAYL